MSIYFLRYNNLIKIGFSSGLQSRVAGIISAIPGEVSFLGHMPGDRDVEAHLHDRFASHRFSGEWFADCDDIQAFIRIALLPEMPVLPRMSVKEPGRLLHGDPTRVALAMRLRQFSARQWPDDTHAQRKVHLAKALGMPGRRLKSLYEAEPTYTLKADESDRLESLLPPLTPA